MYGARGQTRNGGLHLVVVRGTGIRARRGAAHTARRGRAARARAALLPLPLRPLATRRPLPVDARGHIDVDFHNDNGQRECSLFTGFHACRSKREHWLKWTKRLWPEYFI